MAQIRRIGTKVKETKVGSMVTITMRVITSEMETTTATKTSTRVTMVTEMIGMGHMSFLKIMKLLLGMVEILRADDMLHKMVRRFDATDEHIKELRSDLVGIGHKVNTHAISIKQIELQMAQLYATVNTRK